jgi:hypothetical protein
MNNIFNMNNNNDDDDFNLKINLDELFEKKKAHDLSKLNIYKKLLGRIHVRIKTTARQNMDNQHCWFVVPEMIIGIPKYDQGACIAFLMDQLKENNFMVRYIHPNVLFISWKHWVPEYVRNEIKKKVGVKVDGHGDVISHDEKTEEIMVENPDNFILKKNPTSSSNSKKVNTNPFKPTNNYKPSGIYNKDLFGGFDK